MPYLGVIADDLTGANDTGVQFAKAGLRSVVSFAINFQQCKPDTDVLVFDTGSRAASPEDAAGRVKSACLALCDSGISRIYKKIDSTLRGNVAAEIAAAEAEYGPEVTIIAPAFPKAGRYTVGGYQLLNGMPLSMTEFARDPQTPVAEAWLPRLLGRDTGKKVGTVPLQTV